MICYPIVGYLDILNFYLDKEWKSEFTAKNNFRNILDIQPAI